jgi:NADPH-dependent curcumin reductase CurA
MSTPSREIHLTRRPTGIPSPEDFAVVEADVPDPSPGEILVRNDWMSVDPSMRGRMRDVPSYLPPFALGCPMEGATIGTVVASRAAAIGVGDTVWHHLGWRDHTLVSAGDVHPIDTGGLSGSEFLGTLGMPGLTAYLALTRIAPVRVDDVVFISAAAGGVGSVAARVARHLGASVVVGSAGGADKARRLVEELGYDRAVDYRNGPIGAALAAAVPDGIDVYLDNVGGDQLQSAIDALHPGGLVAMCGSVSQANAEAPVPGPTNLALVTRKRLTLRGFIVLDHLDLWDEWIALARGWLEDGTFTSTSTVVDGLDSAVGALIGLLEGANVGKMLVRLHPEAP